MSVGIVTRQRAAKIFLFSKTSQPTPIPADPHSRWLSVALSLEVKRPGREAGHSPQFLVPGLRISRVIPPPPHTVMACTTKNLPFNITVY
jgi:hypothetical protein